jgi:hypothetical protein
MFPSAFKVWSWIFLSTVCKIIVQIRVHNACRHVFLTRIMSVCQMFCNNISKCGQTDISLNDVVFPLFQSLFSINLLQSCKPFFCTLNSMSYILQNSLLGRLLTIWWKFNSLFHAQIGLDRRKKTSQSVKPMSTSKICTHTLCTY